MRLVQLALPILALTACATPESRVRTALLNAGLSKPVSACMAQRMVDRLSLGQLQKLSRLSDLRDTRISELTVGEFLKKTRALGDPQIFAVVSTAGLGCAIAS
jgi:hypothetical protein